MKKLFALISLMFLSLPVAAEVRQNCNELLDRNTNHDNDNPSAYKSYTDDWCACFILGISKLMPRTCRVGQSPPAKSEFLSARSCCCFGSP